MSNRASILLVDDDPLVRELIGAYLCDQDYDVIEANDGNAAMAILRRDTPVDLLLTDIVMPGSRDGFALSRDACRLRPNLRVLHFTGQPASALAPGTAGAVMHKPLDKPTLLARIAELLGRWSVDRNPILARAYDYWVAKSAGRPAPDRRDLDPNEIKDILPHLSIVEIVGAGDDVRHRFRLVGTAVIDALGYEPTNRHVEDIGEGGHGDFMRRLFGEVSATGQPLYAASSFSVKADRLSTERILLPFTQGGAAIRQIVMVQTFDFAQRKGTIHQLTQEHATRRDSIERPPMEPAAAAKSLSA